MLLLSAASAGCEGVSTLATSAICVDDVTDYGLRPIPLSKPTNSACFNRYVLIVLRLLEVHNNHYSNGRCLLEASII